MLRNTLVIDTPLEGLAGNFFLLAGPICPARGAGQLVGDVGNADRDWNMKMRG